MTARWTQAEVDAIAERAHEFYELFRERKMNITAYEVGFLSGAHSARGLSLPNERELAAYHGWTDGDLEEYRIGVGHGEQDFRSRRAMYLAEMRP